MRSLAWAVGPLILVLSLQTAEAGGYRFQTIAQLDGLGGAPVDGLGIDAAGNLYGAVRSRGFGTVFKLDAGASTAHALASFNGAGGDYSLSGVTVDAAGNVYGSIRGFGTAGEGMLYKIDGATGALTTLAAFDGTNESHPETGLAVDAAGNVYGLSRHGAYGLSRDGVAKLDAATGALTRLAPGVDLSVDVAVDAAGNVYGATLGHQDKTFGSLFKLDAATGALHTLVSFEGLLGAGLGPSGNLTLDAAGNLYVSTAHSSPYDDIGIFKYDAETGDLTNLALFGGRTTILGGPVVDAAGNVYGISLRYDYGFGGEVFKIDAHTGVLSAIHTFAMIDGTFPYSGLTVDAKGNLYGAWSQEGRDYIFRISVVPEPAGLVMLGLGAGAVGLVAVRRKRRPAVV